MNLFLSSLLSHLVTIVETLAAANNPAFAPVIKIAADGINAELASIASGNAVTTQQVAENVAPGALALGASLAVKNNPTHADAIAGSLTQLIAAIPAPASTA